MEKRVTLTIVLCVAVFIVWTNFIAPPVKPPVKKPGEAPTKTERNDEGQGAEAKGGETKNPPAPVEVPDANYPDVPDIVVDTDLYRCVVSAKGASIRSFKLKDYFVEAALPAEAKEDPANWLEVLADFEPGQGSLRVNVQRAKGADLGEANWRVKSPLAETDGVQRITFERQLEDGGRIEKDLEFRDGAYAVDMVVRLQRAKGSPSVYKLDVVGPAGIVHEIDAFFTPFAAVDQGKLYDPLVREASSHADGSGYRRTVVAAASNTRPRYVATSDKYFISVLTLPPDTDGTAGIVRLSDAFTGTVVDRERQREAAAKLKTDPNSLQAKYAVVEAGAYYSLGFNDNDTVAAAFSLYAGPRDRRAFNDAGFQDTTPVLSVINYTMCGMGWLIQYVSAACKFLLKLFYGLVHNYGFAILMLTLVIKLAMFPLTRKQMVSMQTYQAQIAKIKPEMERINEKYKSNPQKKQQKIMALYKEHKISPVPVAGCLPLLVNIPVFFGLFHALRSAAELRHEPFIGWIKDLAAPDALVKLNEPVALFCTTIESINVLPVIMGITWFAQMAMAPKPADPQAAQQQKIMMFMPLMFMFVLYNYAAGLSLYWTFNSMLGIIEQKIIRKNLPPNPAMAAKASPPKSNNKNKKK